MNRKRRGLHQSARYGNPEIMLGSAQAPEQPGWCDKQLTC